MFNVSSSFAIERGVLALPVLVMLSVLSGVLISIPFLSPDHYGLAWVGFIPLLIAIEGASLLRSYYLGAITGFVFSVSAGYWAINFLMLSKGYSVLISAVIASLFWVYCAQLFALITLGFCWLKRHTRMHECLLFPVIVVSIYAAYPMIFTIHLGESQSRFLIALQAIQFVGVHGLDAIIALTNVVLFRIVLRALSVQSLQMGPSSVKHLKIKVLKWPYGVAVLLLVSWFYYGWTSNQAWDFKIKQWDTVRLGLVQPNEVPSLEKQILFPGYSRAYPPEMAMTERLASDGAEIVIWPEAKYKAYFDQPQVAEAYHHQIKALNTRLIFQDIERTPNLLSPQINQQYNTAFMLSEQGELIGKYQKMKRIAFGEYVPFASDMPILKRWVEGFFGAFLNEMKAGTAHQVFKTRLPQENTLNIIPLICYETMFPRFVANAVADAFINVKTVDLLVGLSSDGWFGITHQPYQHVNASILRAVENRLPLVHVLNNGPSIVAMPNGKVIFKTQAHQAGGYIVDVPYEAGSQGSFFSHHPQLFIYSVYILMFFLCILSVLKIRYTLLKKRIFN
jgi:apolipoprotein N-acyltransferase